LYAGDVSAVRPAVAGLLCPADPVIRASASVGSFRRRMILAAFSFFISFTFFVQIGRLINLSDDMFMTDDT
jgi:hypothetical protein